MIRLAITEVGSDGDERSTTLLEMERDVSAESINLPAILAAFTKQKRVRKPREAKP